MSDTLKKLCDVLLSVGTSPQEVYITPENTKTIVKEMIICNTTSAPITVWIQYGGLDIIYNKSIPANETYIINLHSILESGMRIEGSSSSTGATAYISGIEVTAS